MGFRMKIFFIICILGIIHNSNGCTMDGVVVWQLPITVKIEDYHEGIIFQRGISNIGGFTLTSYNDLNGGPYVDAAIENSEFVLRTNEAYKEYEDKETSELISLTFSFSCTNGVTLPSPLTILIEINDNNNNPPLFRTPDTAASDITTYQFTIAPPVPPGFLITNCVSDIIVRDIDLTTYRIDFGIEDNPYIAIEYDGSTDPKEYKAVLKTTTFIRSIPEPIVLTISATDVDETGDPPITRSTTVTITGSSEFELPAEPVFSQAFYLASYSATDDVTLEEPILLQQGYDQLVQFSLEGDYAADHFTITNIDNQVILSVTAPLPPAALQEPQVYLVVHATREHTSGGSATIVVQIPAAVGLEFERPHYEGEIVDNTLQLSQLILSQGYEGSAITVTVEDYPSFFTASLVGNTITLSMTPLDDNIIQENNFINLRVTASTSYSSATAIVTLEIIKDDVTTPAFDRPLYTGTYDSTTGLTVDPILLVQGYDNTVAVTLSGEYESYFELGRDGPSSTLRVSGSGLPSHILSESHLLLSIQAAKPRTVGATAVVSITLPGARELQFEALSYKGTLQDNILTLETIFLSTGYDEDVIFSLSGDYSTSFAVSNVQNQVTIHLPAPLPEEVISENNFLMLTLTANGLNMLPTAAAVLVEIIKDDITTPVFGQPIYYGTYLESRIEIPNINLSQGYDSSVTFRIEGENAEYFSFAQSGNSVTLTVQSSIPEEVVFREKAFIFSILAEKPLTVGANAAIVIKFDEDLTEPTVMQFAQNTYIGSIENNVFTLESIILETGYAVGTQFRLLGDNAASFTHTVTNNAVTLAMTGELSNEFLENNKFIVLELEASRERAVSVVAGIIIDLVKEEIVIPVFSQAFYSGVYSEENALQFQETITLTQGFDETVTFTLEGESAAWFAVVQNGNSATIVSTLDVPRDVLDSHHQLLFTIVANKPNTINGSAAISVDLPKDVLEQEVLNFARSSYEGRLNGSELQVPTITLSNDITENILISLSGAYASYFTATRDSNVIHIELLNDLPSEVISMNEFIVIDIIASKPDAVSGYTVLVLSIVKETIIVTPVFEQPYYNGELSVQGELLFEHNMRLIQGFDESVSFTLNGDGSERFILTQSGNSVTLSIAEGGIEDIENIHHFVFSIVANKAGSISGQAAIVIHNADSYTPRPLSFSQNYYKGSIEEDTFTMELISFVEGYNSDVQLTLSGDYVEYFQLVGQDGTYTLQLVTNIPNEIIEANNVLVYSLEAYTIQARTHATVIVELIKEYVNETEALTFDEAYYIGSYSATSGNMADIRLRIASGYDDNMAFNVEEAIGTLFNIQHADSIVTISLVAPLPVELFIDNQPVIFALNGINSAGKTTTATIVVSLEGELSDITVLGFERSNYLGSIESGNPTLDSIVLTLGYSTEVQFTLQGDLSNYFSINQQGSTLNLQLQTVIPEEFIPANRIIVLELQATAAQAVSATTTIVLEVVADLNLAFNAAYYIGHYSEPEGLVFNSIISLEFGYDENVQFSLEGEHAQWFVLQDQGNAVALIASSAIPPSILANNHQLVFSVAAQKSVNNIATATVVISLIDDNIDILGFESANYLGSIENDMLSFEPIVLNQGYTDAVTFTLHGDLAAYFDIQQQGSTVNIVLQSAIPDQTMPPNGIVLLELRALAPQAVAATATLVVEARRNVVVEELTFSAPYYIGQYIETGGLAFDSTISLNQGYDQNVQFTLDGEHAQWFALQVQDNAATITTTGAIPPAILANNHQLIFSVTAQKPNSNIALATIVISLVDDYTNAALLGFERASYLGAIEDEVLSIETIVLNEGYTEEVIFTLHGDVSSYFDLQQQDSIVNIVLQSTIPEQALPANGIVLLELRASALQAVPATTTIIIQVRRAVVVEELAFSAAYYIGQYSETEGLAFDTTILLGVGYDENVRFDLEGEHSQWFALQVQGNTVTITMAGAIPPAILVNNHQLVFSVSAQKLNSNIASATVVISLVDDYINATLLGFERASYLGAIQGEVLSIEPIVLNEGYTNTVTFTLHGDLSSYFDLQQQDSTVTIVLQSTIPEQALPANGIVLLELRASAPQAVAALTTVVIEIPRIVVVEEITFSAAYYIGQYSEADGLAFETAISLDVGYDQDVQFALEGDHGQWFALQVQGNAVTLFTTGAIPPAILVNNHQLIFSVTAQKPNSNIAVATVVISLVDDYTEATLLGFERATYLGTIQDDALSIEPVILNEGFLDAVTFTLHGELSSYFNLQQQGSTVNIVLQSAIPDQALPANGIVLLELRASAPQAIAATTTIIIEARRVVTEDEFVFSAAYYIGQYSETEGLAFESTITLDVGYDQDVQFALDGEHAQWFALQIQDNAVTLIMTGTIPPAILANNHQLVFSITAQKSNSNIASATVVISLLDDYTGATLLGFERASYIGALENDVLGIEPIVLNEGYMNAVIFTLHGDLASYFSLQQQGSTVNIVLQSAIPDQALPANGIVLLELRASAPQAIAATTTIIIETRRVVTEDELVFSAAYYIGQYSETEGLAFESTITLDVGFDLDVQFALEGEHAQWFSMQIQDNAVTLIMTGTIPPAILANNHQLVFSITAQKSNSNIASATMVISLLDDFTGATLLGFERASYSGVLENDVLDIEAIVLGEGYTDAVVFTLHGDLASHFNLHQQGSLVDVVLQSAIPEQTLPTNGIVLLELRASSPQAIPATTTIIIEVRRAVTGEDLVFSAAYYIGQYSEIEGLAFDTTISLDMGYDQNVQFALDGEHAQWFAMQVEDNAVTLITVGAISPAVLVNNHQLVFSIIAQKPNSNIASATVVISLVDDFIDSTLLGFEKASYLGTIANDVLNIESISLNEGYTEAVTFTLHGDLTPYFNLQQQGSTVNILLQSVIPDQALPANGIVLLELRASAPQVIAAMTTIIIEARQTAAIEELVFSADYYTGQYSETEGLVFDTTISLDVGYDQDVALTLEGDYAQWFGLSFDGNSISLNVIEPIPPAVLVDVRKIIMTLRALKAGYGTSTIIVISVIDDSGSSTTEAFDKVLYEGTINLNVIQHEPITITGYAGGDVEMFGVYRELFSASVSEGTVVVGASGTLALPETVAHVALELRTGGASAVLIFDVIQSVTPELPTVSFGSPSYVLRTDMTHTGLVGQLSATSSNGESVSYSLIVNNAHLRERISINNLGEIHLSAPSNTGVYSFQATATSTITQVQATASVQLTIEVITTCGDEHALPPLIILDRDEEEQHENLVVLDNVAHAGCQFRLINRWPLDQEWLYVDNTGLHARSIDREDPRIAFMALSQVQVELVLECDSDSQRRAKRSTTNPRLDWLGPYEYGSNKWILTDTILYNSRRSFVNLIVNDINDNYPIFVSGENEPIVCGYPIPELEDIVLPRALTELKATDADVGENAALAFWSSSEELAVAPTTGSVHVRDGASLSQDQILTVSVTDLNGREGGLTSTIQLMVKLIDTSHIAVVTVRNAFLDQEETILSNLSSAVGYEVKVLSSAVISDDPSDSANARHKRDVTAEGASMQLYVYGIIAREPVAITQLARDITENVYGVDVTSTVSLEDYLEGRQIYGGTRRDTGLLVATIVLSVLLFILIVAIAVWFFLRWRKAQNYEQFSDANSIASQNEPLDTPPKLDSLKKPRLNIDELKRSERRLQEMLDAPIEEVAPKPTVSRVNPEEALDTIINIAPTENSLPIVIQSIDKLKDDANSADEDEFGERKTNSRRKSVVTFNENVEKIIHVEDIPDDNTTDVEVFRF